MRKLIATIVLGTASLGLVAQPVGAKPPPPTPETMQAWAEKQRRYTTTFMPVLEAKVLNEQRQSERIYASPRTAVAILDSAWATKRLPDDPHAERIVGEISHDAPKWADDVSDILTHSPDKKLNKLTNKSLNQVSDTFKEIELLNFDEATQDAGRTNKLWTQVEAAWKAYGIDTGDPWALAHQK
jgi:hypothetical protein